MFPEQRTNSNAGGQVTNFVPDGIGFNGGVHGAFSYQFSGQIYSETGSTNGFIFNAHNSNAIYTDNGKVMPLSISKQSYIIYKWCNFA